MEAQDKIIHVDITSLRENRRPLWMSHLGITGYAEMLGDGGDIYTDRLAPEWERFEGEELSEEDAQSFESTDYSSVEAKFQEKSAITATSEEAFMYVHSTEEE